MKCSVDGCDRESVCRGWCRPHYRRWQRTGEPGSATIRAHSSAPTHGTMHGYRYHGCRCDACTERWNRYHRDWSAANKDRVHLYDRNNLLKNVYGMTSEQFDEMLAAQGGGCAICGSTETDRRKRYLSVDHDHDSGVVRGILCDPCNQGIARFRDDPALLRAAAEYLSQEREGVSA